MKICRPFVKRRNVIFRPPKIHRVKFQPGL